MSSLTRLISVALLLFGVSATASIAGTQTQGIIMPDIRLAHEENSSDDAKTPAQKVAEICGKQPLAGAVVGVYAINLKGDTVAMFNHRQKMVPASNVKLITTGLALKELGADYRFETKLAHSGTIEGGVLKGDLYIVGGGDPTTGARNTFSDPVATLFGKWLGILKRAGISKIDGRIVADPRFFDNPNPENLGWTKDDLGTNYGVGPTGLNFFENAQNFLIVPASQQGQKPSIKPQYPETPWLQYRVSATTGAPRSANTIFYVNTRLAPVGEFAGSFPVDRRAYTFEGSNRFGAYTCAHYFKGYLSSNGIGVSGGAADINSDGMIRLEPGFGDSGVAAEHQDSLKHLGSSYSATLSQIVKETNCESDNFFAETLLKMVAKKYAKTCNSDDCVDAAELALRNMGVVADGSCQLFDGSGLSRKNYISAEYFVKFLKAMALSPEYEDYLHSLPMPGGKGTLEYKFVNEPSEFKSRIRMKSGSMNGVRCYSGYILPSSGNPEETIIFSLLTNNVIASSWVVNPSIDAIIKAIAEGN